MKKLGGPASLRWRESLLRRLAELQSPDGSIAGPSKQTDKVYDTALSAMCLGN